MHKTNKTKAFTLLEMLLVIAIIAILAGIVIIAINPGRQLAQARNAQRASDLKALHSAVQQYYIDNVAYPTGLNGTLQEVCDADGEPTECVDLADALVPTYIPAIPTDPQAVAGTGYQIAINPTTQAPELTAPNSTEYDMVPVQLGTTTLVQTGGEVDYSCGDPTDIACWSEEESDLAWDTAYLDFINTDVTETTNTYDGKDNTAILYTLGTTYQAAYHCYTLDEDIDGEVPPPGTWYLPSYAELWAAYTANSSMFMSEGYWSSTESSGSPEDLAWGLDHGPRRYVQRR